MRRGRRSAAVDGEAEVLCVFGESFGLNEGLSQFSLRKLACIHDLFHRFSRVMMDLVDM